MKRGIAIVPEGARVFPDMEVLDNLKMGSYLSEGKGGAGRRTWRRSSRSSLA